MKINRFLALLLATICCSMAMADEMENVDAYDEGTTDASLQEEAGWTVESRTLMPVDSVVKAAFVQKDHAPWDKENWTLLRTNPGVKPFKVRDELTFVGIPVFVAGWIAKSEKHAFKQQDRHSLVTHFKTEIDNYTQYFGPSLALALKVGGVEGRSDWGRFLTTSVMSYFMMDWTVTAIKYTAREMRPNGTSANSWPSGHTATSFAGATILHKEYGLTRSPWYSVAGYGVATATGVMRILNNAHWVSDVLSGAGVGIMTTELAYAASDLIFRDRGLLRNNLTGNKSIIENPSFFSISMGMGWGSRNVDFDMGKFGFEDEDGDRKFNLKFGTSMAMGVEGAYFFNKYVGVGGRLRVNASPIKGWNSYAKEGTGKEFIREITKFNSDEDLAKLMEPVGKPGEPGYMPGLVERDAQGNYNCQLNIDSDHLTDFTCDIGAYFNFPLSRRLALGSKLLVGRSVMQELSMSANVKGGVLDYSVDYSDDESYITDVYHLGTYDTTWDLATMGGNNTFKVGTGVSLTYAYKHNYAWKLFLDYDFSRKTYTMTYNPGGFIVPALPELGFSMSDFEATQSIKKSQNTFVLGGSFTVNF